MTAHELVIRLGRPVAMTGQAVSEIRVPFPDRESAEAAQRDITVHVRPARGAGPAIVPGEVIREAAETAPEVAP